MSLDLLERGLDKNKVDFTDLKKHTQRKTEQKWGIGEKKAR